MIQVMEKKSFPLKSTLSSSLNSKDRAGQLTWCWKPHLCPLMKSHGTAVSMPTPFLANISSKQLM